MAKTDRKFKINATIKDTNVVQKKSFLIGHVYIYKIVNKGTESKE